MFLLLKSKLYWQIVAWKQRQVLLSNLFKWNLEMLFIIVVYWLHGNCLFVGWFCKLYAADAAVVYGNLLNNNCSVLEQTLTFVYHFESDGEMTSFTENCIYLFFNRGI